MNRRTLFILVVAATIMMTAGRTDALAAEGVREAKVHAERALRQYNLGNFEAAIAEFSKAYEIDPSPIFLFNIGQSHRHLGNLDRAVFFFKRYLNETGTDAPSRDEAQRNIHDLEEKIAQQKMTPEKPPGSSLAPAAPTPSGSPRLSPPTAPAPTSGTARDAPSQVPTAPPTPQLKPIAAEPRGSTTTTPEPDRTSTKRTLAWVAGGGALAGLGAAVVFHIAASGKLSDFNHSCGLDQNGTPFYDPKSGTGLTDAQCVADHNAWHTDLGWAEVGYVVGGALAVTSAVLFLTSRSTSPPSENRAFLDCRPGPGTVVCGGVF